MIVLAHIFKAIFTFIVEMSTFEISGVDPQNFWKCCEFSYDFLIIQTKDVHSVYANFFDKVALIFAKVELNFNL